MVAAARLDDAGQSRDDDLRDVFEGIWDALERVAREIDARSEPGEPERVSGALLSSGERAVVASYVDGRSVSQVAEHLDLDAGHVRAQLRRARGKYTAAGHGVETRSALRSVFDERDR